MIERDKNIIDSINADKMKDEKIKQPIEYIVQYEMNRTQEKGEYGIPLSVERAIPYIPTHHVPIIGMVSYTPLDENEDINLQKKIEEAYDNGVISSYERIERNITLKIEYANGSFEPREDS